MISTRYKGNFVHPLVNSKGENTHHTVGDVFSTNEWYGQATWIVKSIEKDYDDKGRPLDIIHAVWKDVAENPERKVFFAVGKERE